MCFAGLIGLQLHARDREPPLVRIADIKPYMNFSSLAVQGELAAEPCRLRNGSILYSIDDGSGILAVFSDPSSQDNGARIGDKMMAVGRLSIGAGNNVRLQVRSGGDIALERRPGAWTSLSDIRLSDITAGQQGSNITVCGRISRIWTPEPDSRSPHRMVLVDGDGRLDVVNWLAERPGVRAGDVVEVTGNVQVYKGRVQIKLMDGADIRVIN